MDKSGTECIREVSQIMNFNESQKAKGEEILKLLEELTVEEGTEILEKCTAHVRPDSPQQHIDKQIRKWGERDGRK